MGTLVKARNAIVLEVRSRWILENHTHKDIILYRLFLNSNERDKYPRGHNTQLQLAILGPRRQLVSVL
jgi:hypothetical protein